MATLRNIDSGDTPPQAEPLDDAPWCDCCGALPEDECHCDFREMFGYDTDSGLWEETVCMKHGGRA